ncbi:hypothetical protein FOA52_010817 [Chlamydomonas sp. UWO 241]|nr:hypothetical protein FOA52_010817 [Chlamydomonas sp. UWO 241]
MAPPFVIPSKTDALEKECGDAPPVVANPLSTEDADVGAPAAAEEAIDALGANDALHLADYQPCFDDVYNAVKHFDRLPPRTRGRLLGALCDNVTFLVGSIPMLARLERSDPALLQHRNALQQYAFFLAWGGQLADDLADAALNSAAGAKGAAGGKRPGAAAKRALASTAGKAFDWGTQGRDRLLGALLALLKVDASRLFDGAHEQARMVDLFAQFALAVLQKKDALKRDSTRALCFDVLCVAAFNHARLPLVAEALMAAVRKRDNEHLAEVAGSLALHAESAPYRSDQLAVALIQEFIKVEPAAYDDQAAGSNSAAVKHLADVVACLAELTPKAVASHISQLLPYLGCNTYGVRTAVVHIMGSVLANVFAKQDTPDERGQQARIASKQSCMNQLLERVLDKSAHTRKEVLRAWAALAEQGCVPVGLLPKLVSIAHGRVSDGSVIVAKEALKLLQALVAHSPFGAKLDAGPMLASQRELEERLKAILSERGIPEGEEGEEGGATGAAGEGDKAGGEEWQDAGAVARHAGEAEEDGAAQVQAQESAAAPPPGTQLSQTQADDEPLGALSSDVTTLQTMIATLKSGVQFVRAMLAAMPEVRALLLGNGAGVDVVREAISLLVMCRCCHLVGVPELSSDGAQGLVVADTDDGGTDKALRAAWPLVFSNEGDGAVREAVVDAVYNLYLLPVDGRGHQDAAKKLIRLAIGATLGEISSLDEIIRLLVAAGPGGGVESGAAASSKGYELHRDVVSHVFSYLKSGLDVCVASAAAGADGAAVAASARARKNLRACAAVVSMVSAHAPRIAVLKASIVLEVLSAATGTLQDAWVARHCLSALKSLAPLLLPTTAAGSTADAAAILTAAHTAACRVMLTSGMGQGTWHSAAEAAVDAMYALHPRPYVLMQTVLQAAAKGLLPSSSSSGDGATAFSNDRMLCPVSAARLGRFLFLVGHIAINQLALIDNLARAIRKGRATGALAAAEASAAGGGAAGGGEGDIAAQVGGTVVADAQLEALQECCNRELLRGGGEAAIADGRALIATAGVVVQAVCYSETLMQVRPMLRAPALLALSKLMAVDAGYCDSNMRLFFTLLSPSRQLEAGIRCNMVVAMADLAFRYPNVIEPWTPHMYLPLIDPDVSVRKRALSVLSHLILNDMMKVKGHVAKVAMCMREGEDPSVQRLARAFFSTLAKKSHKNSNPIYNMLPDILSHLSRERGISPGEAEAIMESLLEYIKQDKQQDSLREKICARFELVSDTQTPVEGGGGGGDAEMAEQQEQQQPLPTGPAASEPRREWALLAACVRRLGYSDKGMRRTIEQLRCYKPALGMPEVLRAFEGLAAQARKQGDKKGDLREILVVYEAQLKEAHEALRIEEICREEVADEAAAGEEVAGQADADGAVVADGAAVADEAATEEEVADEARAGEVAEGTKGEQPVVADGAGGDAMDVGGKEDGEVGAGEEEGGSAEEGGEAPAEETEAEKEEATDKRRARKRVASNTGTPVVSRRKRQQAKVWDAEAAAAADAVAAAAASLSLGAAAPVSSVAAAAASAGPAAGSKAAAAAPAASAAAAPAASAGPAAGGKAVVKTEAVENGVSGKGRGGGGPRDQEGAHTQDEGDTQVVAPGRSRAAANNAVSGAAAAASDVDDAKPSGDQASGSGGGGKVGSLVAQWNQMNLGSQDQKGSQDAAPAKARAVRVKTEQP